MNAQFLLLVFSGMSAKEIARYITKFLTNNFTIIPTMIKGE